MVTGDEHSKAFRDSMSHLIEYSQDNELPERLQAAMKEHLVVHFDSAQTSDDQVLGIYPTSMRRRALRHLYLQPIKGCYLFRGCKQRFLDALLTAARVELFLPGVEIVTEGDNVVELLIVVAGEVAVSQGGSRMGGSYLAHASSVFVNSGVMSFTAGTGGGASGVARGSMSFTGNREGSVGSMRGDASASDLEGGSVHVGRLGALSPGGGPPRVNLSNAQRRGCSDALAEVAFFTDGASHEAVVGTTPVRVLSLPKAAWELLVQQFPQQIRIVLENVQRATEASVQDNLKAAAAKSQLTAEQLHVALSLVAGAAGFENTDPLVLAQTRGEVSVEL
ncbi:hypothetical protein GPECTOR_1004g270 [Gonium pectorale]|uniref:Cyclic nucleotide-binding domain-containing protein n=1 Tax=Gonium pectorale TaxID=33097 RepID=A0A150FUZ8_GONPE|nr:hypothetical protein GPECTOR_1004g270 [Gonium pectorale]|eukprot:KXZ41005.1 hypothetical protein GPECTOR_1004g270 [Gonium pectorale]